MKNFDIYFKGVYQGSYTRFSFVDACVAWALEYNCDLDRVVQEYGAYPCCKNFD